MQLFIPDGNCTSVCHRGCVGSREGQNYTYGHQPHPEQPEKGCPNRSVGPSRIRPQNLPNRRRPTSEGSRGRETATGRLLCASADCVTSRRQLPGAIRRSRRPESSRQLGSGTSADCSHRQRHTSRVVLRGVACFCCCWHMHVPAVGVNNFAYASHDRCCSAAEYADMITLVSLDGESFVWSAAGLLCFVVFHWFSPSAYGFSFPSCAPLSTLSVSCTRLVCSPRSFSPHPLVWHSIVIAKFVAKKKSQAYGSSSYYKNTLQNNAPFST